MYTCECVYNKTESVSQHMFYSSGCHGKDVDDGSRLALNDVDLL